MSIDNRAEWLAYWAANGYILTDHIYFGSNRLVRTGTYSPTFDSDGNLVAADNVTFVGTAGRDTFLGGGGEFSSIFLGTRGDDLYGGGLALGDDNAFYYGVADYSGARSRVVIDMDYTGSRTFTDEDGQVRTVSILGRAVKDGYGGQDDFMEGTAFGGGYSSVTNVIGSRFADTMVGFTAFGGLYGGGGNDRLVGNQLYGGDGNDVLIHRALGDFDGGAFGGEGNDVLIGSDFVDADLVGGAGNDRIFAGGGNDGVGNFAAITGNEGNDIVDGGSGNDFIDGGIGRDRLFSGSGNDIINPDVEEFQGDPNQPRDGDRDVIYVTRDDLGDFNDVVLSRAFEEGLDVIRFVDAVRGGVDFRVYEEAQSFNDATGRLFRGDDLADRQNTVLEIDWNDDGFDADDYFLHVVDASLSLQGGFLLT